MDVLYKGERSDLAWEMVPGPQQMATRSTVDVLNYGGARGGGKSEWLLYEASKRVHLEGYKALISRRSFPQLSDLLERANNRYPKLGLKWEASNEKTWWKHPNGGFIKFVSFKDEKPSSQNGVDKIQGHEYQFIGIDQAEQYTETMLDRIGMCNRSSVPGVPARIRYTTNPGGIGHLYFKKNFVDLCKPVPEGPRHYSKQYNCYWQPHKPGRVVRDEHGLTRHYIPALVFDNPYLLNNDPIYVRKLLSLKKGLREAMLYGDWSVYEGMFFGDWERAIHVVPGFPIPHTWPRYISVDYGQAHAFVMLWTAINPADGRSYTYREYVMKNKPLKYHAAALRALSRDEEIEKVILPHDMWREEFVQNRNGGDPIKTTIYKRFKRMIGAKYSITMAPSGPGTRRVATDMMKDALFFNRSVAPRWYIFNSCEQLVETMPAMQPDENDFDKLLKMQDDDTVDAIMKYWLYYQVPDFPFRDVTAKGVGQYGRADHIPNKEPWRPPEDNWMVE